MDFGNNIQTWLLGGTALGGLLTAFWGWIKLMGNHVCSLFYVRVTCNLAIQKALYAYCWNQLKVSPFGYRNYGGAKEFVRPRQRVLLVAFESFNNSTVQKIFWKGYRPIFFTYSESDGVVAIFPRLFWDVDQFMVEVEDYYNNFGLNSETRFRIAHRYGSRSPKGRAGGHEDKKTHDSGEDYFESGRVNLMQGEARILKWKPSDLGYIPRGGFDTLEFDATVWSHVNDIRQWLKSENWYLERNLTWKRGWLLLGQGGVGKSSLVRAMAKEFNLPVFVFDLASFEDEEFMLEWKRMQSESPCIVLCEDIDTIFNGRTNVTSNDLSVGLNFDTFLNAIDGVEQSHGLFLCITTNRVALLDDALGVKTVNGVSSRPGRIDVILELPVLNAENRRKIGIRILKGCGEQLEQVVQDGEGETGAQFTERCSKLALDHYWSHRPQ